MHLVHYYPYYTCLCNFWFYHPYLLPHGRVVVVIVVIVVMDTKIAKSGGMGTRAS